MTEQVLDERFLWQKAVSFAARQHHGQLRKDGRTPYVAHPFRVALTVRHVFGEDDTVALCTALLHDVIEDTTTDFDDLVSEFGAEIAEAVACLTKDKRLPEKEREDTFYQAIGRGSWQARLVKLADTFDNVSDSATAKMRAKAVAKGRLAITAAGDDPRLAGAVAILRQLLDENHGVR